jgi:hypothetical protein
MRPQIATQSTQEQIERHLLLISVILLYHTAIATTRPTRWNHCNITIHALQLNLESIPFFNVTDINQTLWLMVVRHLMRTEDTFNLTT